MPLTACLGVCENNPMSFYCAVSRRVGRLVLTCGCLRVVCALYLPLREWMWYVECRDGLAVCVGPLYLSISR